MQFSWTFRTTLPNAHEIFNIRVSGAVIWQQNWATPDAIN